MKDQYINPAFPHMIHGADYNPEQWMHDRAIRDRDMELMTGANMNELTVGIFSWAVLYCEMSARCKLKIIGGVNVTATC